MLIYIVIFLISIIIAAVNGILLLLLDQVLHNLLGLVNPLLCCVHHLPHHVLSLVCHLSHPLLEPAEPGDEGADAAAGALGGEAGLVVMEKPHHDGGTGKTANKESCQEVVRHLVESVVRLV